MLQVMPTASSVMKARRAYLQEEASRHQAEIVADTNSQLSRASNELDMLRTLFNIVPKDGFVYGTVSQIVTDKQNIPQTLEIVAGLTPDGNPLDLSIFPSTSLPVADFPILGLL